MSRTRSVIAMANTPSLNASTRFVSHRSRMLSASAAFRRFLFWLDAEHAVEADEGDELRQLGRRAVDPEDDATRPFRRHVRAREGVDQAQQVAHLGLGRGLPPE